MLSTNFYWQHVAQDQFDGLMELPRVTLDGEASARTEGDKTLLTVSLHNNTDHVALLSHLQLHQKKSGRRVLPVFYSDNYISLVPGESSTVTIEAATKDFQGDQPLLEVDGYNVDVKPMEGPVAITTNLNAQPLHWPATDIVPAAGPQKPDRALGLFEGSTDVGATLKGDTVYDPATGEYRVTGGGADMWGATDAFHMTWLRASGDGTLTADVRFPADGGAIPLKKAVLIVRQNLDPDSAYVDVAIHGDGHITLQYRETKGGQTADITSPQHNSTRLRIVRKGDQFTMYTGSADGKLTASGTVKIALKDPVYVRHWDVRAPGHCRRDSHLFQCQDRAGTVKMRSGSKAKKNARTRVGGAPGQRLGRTAKRMLSPFPDFDVAKASPDSVSQKKSAHSQFGMGKAVHRASSRLGKICSSTESTG